MNTNYKTIEYILDNGLKVLLYNYPGSHSATFMVWYKAGSRNEVQGKTGLAHFLEHLSFKKTDFFKAGQIVAEITRNGGAFNAYTSRDFTSYYETFATHKLELAMMIESQRMHNLILDEKDREREVGVILSELEKSLDNPYSALETAVRNKAYEKHPYKNPIIGWEEDIKSITIEDLQDFYNRFYTPNNATIVIVGNFDQLQTIEMVKKYFGDIPPKEVNNYVESEPQQNSIRRVRVKKNGSSPIIKLAYHIPPASNEDIFPLITVAEMLNLGISSRAYQAIVETQIATDLSVNAEIARNSGLFTIMATLFPGITHTDAKEKVVEQINNLSTTKPPTIEELEKTKRRITSSFEFNKDGTFKLAYLLGYYETIQSYKIVDNYVRKIQQVTINDIQKVAEKYLTSSNSTIGYFMPSKNYSEKISTNYDYTPQEASSHIYKEASIIIKEKIKFAPINFTKKVLSNGINILVSENKTSNTVKLFGTINAGNLYSSSINHVLPVMCAGMLNRGSLSKSKIEIANEVESRGASVGISNVGEAVNFSLSSTIEDFPHILQILSKVLSEPAFPEDEFEKYKKFAIAGVRQKRDNPAYLAHIAFSQLVYPKGHIFYNHSLNNQEKHLRKVTLEHVKDFYDNYYSPHTIILGVSGNVQAEKVFKLVRENFGNWKAKKIPIPLIKSARLQKKVKEKTICVKGKAETEIIMGHYGNLSRKNEDFHKAIVMNFIFGGSGALSSRIGLKIREELGLVYSISSTFSALLIPGSWSVKFGVDNKYIDVVIDTVKKELENFVEKGVTDHELELAKSCLIGSYPLRFTNNSGIARALLINEFYDLGDDYFDNYTDIINSITKEQINDTAQKYLHPDLLTIVKAGYFE